jgi:hypothetical protein
MKMKFLDVLKDKKITIPIIQRDYVQGLYEKKAKDFLKAIKKAIDNKKNLNLDFIYGSEKDDKFIPIDGQQRLTTLFLLTYYLSLEDEYIKELKNFSYEIRPSSEEFFSSLTKKENWEKLKRDNLADSIKNSNWYFLSWGNDLTVKSALNMLNLIEKEFKNYSLKDLENITFEFLDLKEFSLDEDLYVKMNARGKQLSKFENFKAEFEKYIDGLDESKEEKERIKAKLDNEWFDIFWNLDYIKADEYYYNFFFNGTFNFYAENLKKTDNKKYDIERDFLKEKEIFDFYENVYQNQENIKRVIKLLDNLQKYPKLKEFCKIKSEPKYYERLYFYIWSLGILKNFDEINQKRWERVATNLVKNTRIEDIDTFINIVQEVLKLSKTISNNVYNEIDFSNIGGFNSIQIEEEHKKIELIEKDKSWEEEIITAEKHWYLDGQIGFLIKYANDDLGEFKQYRDKFFILFDKNLLFKEKDDKLVDNKENQILIHRALLTIDDYLPQHSSSDKYTFCLFDTRLRIKYENWRAVFNDKEKTLIFKALLDKIETFYDLHNIINKFQFNLNDWRSYFINPNQDWNVIKDARNYQIVFKNSENIFLNSGNTRADKWGWRNAKELYTWYIFRKFFNLKPKDKRKERWRMEANVDENIYGLIYYKIDYYSTGKIGIVIEKNDNTYIISKDKNNKILKLELEKDEEKNELINEWKIEDILNQKINLLEEIKKI